MHNYFKKVQKRVASRQKIWYYKFRDSNYGGVTQLVECHTGSVEVVSSSLIVSTKTCGIGWVFVGFSITEPSTWRRSSAG